MIDEATINKAVELLRQAAPDATIILFGSGARGEAKKGSAFDFLVVEPKVTSRREEILRLLDALRPLRIPVDLLVVSQKTYEEWADTPSTLLYEAVREGRSSMRWREHAELLLRKAAQDEVVGPRTIL
jgi:predicted nucleotidyltransferase